MPGSRARSDQRQPLSLWDSAPVWQLTGLGAAASWVVWRGVSPCTGCYMECAPDAYVEWREFRAKAGSGAPSCSPVVRAGLTDRSAPGHAADGADRFLAVQAAAGVAVAVLEVLGRQIEAVGAAGDPARVGDLARVVGVESLAVLFAAQRPVARPVVDTILPSVGSQRVPEFRTSSRVMCPAASCPGIVGTPPNTCPGAGAPEPRACSPPGSPASGRARKGR